MNIKYAEALRLNQFMSTYKPTGKLTGGSILKIIGMKQELTKLQENYYKAFEEVMIDFKVEKNEAGAYSWKQDDKDINKKVEELISSEAKIENVRFMNEDEFTTLIDGETSLEDIAFVHPFLMISTETEEKKSKAKA